MVVREESNYRALKSIYDILNEIIDNNNCFYTKDEVKNLKEDTKNKFIRGENNE